MAGMDSEHVQILGQSLRGERVVDEQTFASLEVLAERLERLKKADRVFGKISFSPAVKKLRSQQHIVAVC